MQPLPLKEPATSRPGRPERTGAFTLIEMMVVIAIIGLLLGASGLALRNVFRAKLRTVATTTAAAMRIAFNRALVHGQYVRLAMNLNDQKLWIEWSEEKVALRSGREQLAISDKELKAEGDDELAEQLARRARVRRRKGRKGGGLLGGLLGGLGGGAATGQGGGAGGAGPGKKKKAGAEAAGDDDESLAEEKDPLAADIAELEQLAKDDLEPEPPDVARFHVLKGPGAKLVKVPKGIVIAAVATPRLKKPISEDMAYIYFFPDGHAEPAIVHIRDEEEVYSVVLHPLTGRARIYACEVKIPETFGSGKERGADDERYDACLKGGAL